jgi:hypothetical protein
VLALKSGIRGEDHLAPGTQQLNIKEGKEPGQAEEGHRSGVSMNPTVASQVQTSRPSETPSRTRP